MTTNAVYDIGDALNRLREAFQYHAIPIPDALIYLSPREASTAMKHLRLHAGKDEAHLLLSNTLNAAPNHSLQMLGFDIVFDTQGYLASKAYKP